MFIGPQGVHDRKRRELFQHNSRTQSSIGLGLLERALRRGRLLACQGFGCGNLAVIVRTLEFSSKVQICANMFMPFSTHTSCARLPGLKSSCTKYCPVLVRRLARLRLETVTYGGLSYGLFNIPAFCIRYLATLSLLYSAY